MVKHTPKTRRQFTLNTKNFISLTLLQLDLIYLFKTGGGHA